MQALALVPKDIETQLQVSTYMCNGAMRIYDMYGAVSAAALACTRIGQAWCGRVWGRGVKRRGQVLTTEICVSSICLGSATKACAGKWVGRGRVIFCTNLFLSLYV